MTKRTSTDRTRDMLKAERERAMAAERKKHHREDDAAGISTLPIRANREDLERALRANGLFPIWENDLRKALNIGLQRVVTAWVSKFSRDAFQREHPSRGIFDSTEMEPDAKRCSTPKT